MKLLGLLFSAGAIGAGFYLMRGGRIGSLSGARRRSRGLRGSAEISELKIFIDNDGQLYRQQTTSILKNLVTKMAKGVYDRAKAEKLWMYLVENGAKKYARESGGEGNWHTMFPIEDRREVARQLNKEFITEAEIGNYDNLLPKKYQKS